MRGGSELSVTPRTARGKWKNYPQGTFFASDTGRSMEPQQTHLLPCPVVYTKIFQGKEVCRLQSQSLSIPSYAQKSSTHFSRALGPGMSLHPNPEDHDSQGPAPSPPEDLGLVDLRVWLTATCPGHWHLPPHLDSAGTISLIHFLLPKPGSFSLLA